MRGGNRYKQRTGRRTAAEEALPHGFVPTNTITSLLIQASYIFLTLFFQFLRDAARFPSSQDALAHLVVCILNRFTDYSLLFPFSCFVAGWIRAGSAPS